MQDAKDTMKQSKVFKVGNSFGLRLTKKDTEKLNVQPGDKLEKHISPDGNSITFKKKTKISPKTQQMMNQIFKEDANLFDALKDM